MIRDETQSRDISQLSRQAAATCTSAAAQQEMFFVAEFRSPWPQNVAMLTRCPNISLPPPFIIFDNINLHHHYRFQVEAVLSFCPPSFPLLLPVETSSKMAPVPTNRAGLTSLTHRALLTTTSIVASHELSKRDLTVRGAQGVTLGAIAAYVVVIAVLWNIPYVHYVLWPFKVSTINKPPPRQTLGPTFYSEIANTS